MHAPSLALTLAVERLIRGGIPGLLENDSAWTETGAEAPRVACPAGHWLCDAGTRLYRGDQKFKTEEPSVIVYVEDDAERWKEREDVSAWWKVKVRVDMIYSRDVPAGDLEEKAAILGLALTQDLDVDGTLSRAVDRLSDASDAGEFLNVRTLLIMDVRASTAKDREGRSAVYLEFTAVCCGVTEQRIDGGPAAVPDAYVIDGGDADGVT